MLSPGLINSHSEVSNLGPKGPCVLRDWMEIPYLKVKGKISGPPTGEWLSGHL